MAHPYSQLLILLPWSVFALAAGLKFWQLTRWLRHPRLSSANSTERFRQALERRWEREQNPA
jgi:hypothetical protein